MPVLPWPAEATPIYAQLAASDASLDCMGLQVAAHAMAIKATLVTSAPGFDTLPGLLVEGKRVVVPP